MIRAVGTALAGLAIALLAVTYWALESGQVAVVETRDASGSTRRTHVWYVETDGVLWLEAGAPENAWFRDVLRDPHLRLSIEGTTRPYVAVPSWDRREHDALRARLRARYGLRDWWVGHFVDSERSLAVRLDPEPDGP